jgi:hypothetical protein
VSEWRNSEGYPLEINLVQKNGAECRMNGGRGSDLSLKAQKSDVIHAKWDLLSTYYTGLIEYLGLYWRYVVNELFLSTAIPVNN